MATTKRYCVLKKQEVILNEITGCQSGDQECDTAQCRYSSAITNSMAWIRPGAEPQGRDYTTDLKPPEPMPLRIALPASPLVAKAEVAPNPIPSGDLYQIRIARVDGTMVGTQVVSSASVTRIGRAPDNDLVMQDSSVSSQHCLLEFRDDSWWVRDLNSRYGTRINSLRVTEARFMVGDRIRIGDSELRLEQVSVAKNVPPESVAPEPVRPSTQGPQPLVVSPLPPPASVPLIASLQAKNDAESGTPTSAVNISCHQIQIMQVNETIARSLVLSPSSVTRIGRAADNDIVIQDSAVSSRHCSLEFRDGAWWIRDLNSRYGTRVNGQGVTETPIKPGDVIRIGDSKFRLEQAPAPKNRPQKVEVTNQPAIPANPAAEAETVTRRVTKEEVSNIPIGASNLSPPKQTISDIPVPSTASNVLPSAPPVVSSSTIWHRIEVNGRVALIVVLVGAAIIYFVTHWKELARGQ
ncbi:MAG: FHA domain-containing protein [Verrucomicrobiota bacterium]